MRRTLLLALALAACDGGPSEVAPGTQFGPLPPGTETECLDSGGCDESPFFDVVYLTWSAQFGYDRATGELTAIATPYGPVEPAIDLLLGTKKWSRSGFDTGDTSAYCLVSLPLFDSDPPGWVTNSDSLWYGVSYRDDDPPVSTCGLPGYELDPSQWGEDPMTAIAAIDYGLGWGVAVGELSDNAAGIVATAFRPEDLPYVFGGSIAVPMLTGTDTEVYGFAYLLDDLGAVHLGDDGSLDAWLADDVRAAAHGPSGVPTAWYNVVALYIYMLNP